MGFDGIDCFFLTFAPHLFSQFILLLPLLAVRIALCIIFLPFVTAVAAALTAGCPADAPLPPRRAAAARAFLSFWARFLLGAGFAVFPRLEGQQNITTAPKIYVFNHVSYLDGLVLAACLHAPSALAKAALSTAPCLGPWTRALQCAYVDRGQGGGTVAALAARLSDSRPWPPLAVAPEGTTKPARCLLRFRTGAFAAAMAAGVPVVPVAIDYDGATNPGWGVVQSTLVHVLRLQTRLTTRARIRVLPPAAALPADTPDTYARRVRSVLAGALGVPEVESGLDDWRALKAGRVAVDWTGRRLMVGGHAVAPPQGGADVRAKEA